MKYQPKLFIVLALLLSVVLVVSGCTAPAPGARGAG